MTPSRGLSSEEILLTLLSMTSAIDECVSTGPHVIDQAPACRQEGGGRLAVQVRGNNCQQVRTNGGAKEDADDELGVLAICFAPRLLGGQLLARQRHLQVPSRLPQAPLPCLIAVRV